MGPCEWVRPFPATLDIMATDVQDLLTGSAKLCVVNVMYSPLLQSNNLAYCNLLRTVGYLLQSYYQKLVTTRPVPLVDTCSHWYLIETDSAYARHLRFLSGSPAVPCHGRYPYSPTHKFRSRVGTGTYVLGGSVIKQSVCAAQC